MLTETVKMFHSETASAAQLNAAYQMAHDDTRDMHILRELGQDPSGLKKVRDGMIQDAHRAGVPKVVTTLGFCDALSEREGLEFPPAL